MDARASLEWRATVVASAGVGQAGQAVTVSIASSAGGFGNKTSTTPMPSPTPTPTPTVSARVSSLSAASSDSASSLEKVSSTALLSQPTSDLSTVSQATLSSSMPTTALPSSVSSIASSLPAASSSSAPPPPPPPPPSSLSSASSVSVPPKTSLTSSSIVSSSSTPPTSLVSLSSTTPTFVSTSVSTSSTSSSSSFSSSISTITSSSSSLSSSPTPSSIASSTSTSASSPPTSLPPPASSTTSSSISTVSSDSSSLTSTPTTTSSVSSITGAPAVISTLTSVDPITTSISGTNALPQSAVKSGGTSVTSSASQTISSIISTIQPSAIVSASGTLSPSISSVTISSSSSSSSILPPLPSETTTSSSPPARSSSTASIVGGVFGSLSALVFAAVIIYLIRRRRYQRRDEADEPAAERGFAMDGPSGRRPSPEVMENLAYLGSPGSRFSDDDDYQNSSTSVIRGNSLFFGRANNNGSTGLVAPNSLLGRLSAFRGPAKDSLAPPQDNRRRGSPDSNSPMINRSHAGGRASMESSYSDLPAPQMSYAGRQYSSEIPDLTLPELPGTRDTAFSSVTPDYTQLSKLEEREKMVAGERMRMKAAMDKAWASPSNHSSLQRFSLFPPPTKNPPPNSLLRAKSADTRLSGEGRLTPDLRPRGLSLERIATRRASRATINGSPEAEMLSPTPEADAPEGSEQALRRPPAGGRILTFAESEHQARRSNHHPHVRSTARPPPHDRVSKAMSKSSEYSHYESPTLPRSSWSIFWGPDQRDTGIAL